MNDTRYTMVTTTSYGSWLPGDARGYVQRGEILPGSPKLKEYAEGVMCHQIVMFPEEEQTVLHHSLIRATQEFSYDVTDLSVESWHLHWVIRHNDSVARMVGRLKNRMRQALGQGRIWTTGYHFRELNTEEELLAARNYIARHEGVRIVNRVPVAPGSARGSILCGIYCVYPHR